MKAAAQDNEICSLEYYYHVDAYLMESRIFAVGDVTSAMILGQTSLWFYRLFFCSNMN